MRYFSRFLFLSLCLPALSQTRPAITGVAHIALKTNDLAAAQRFYGHDLGFDSPFTAGGATYFKINDHQYIHVAPDLKNDAEDRLSHIAFETADAKQLCSYLASKGTAVPAVVTPDPEGNLTLTVKDPEGHEVRFVQYLAGSLQSRNFGKALPESRISTHMIHVGFTVQDRPAEDVFYKDILGFTEMWHGGKTDTAVDWVDMRVPDGDDWLEYMLKVHNPSAKTLGVMHHMALGAPSVDAAYQRLLDRGVSPTEKPKIGRDGKWQLNLYDPNLTRVELMEPKPVETPCCSPMKTR